MNSNFLNNFENKQNDSFESPPMSSQETSTVTTSSYKKKKNKRLIVLLSASIIILALLLLCYLWIHIRVPNFQNKDLEYGKKWAIENNITLRINEEYSNKYSENKIISQSKKNGESILKGQSLSLTLSKGPNNDDIIPLPDFSSMNVSSAKKWITKNNATNIKIVQDFSDEVEKNKFLNAEFKDPNVSNDTYKRGDLLTLHYSKGKETYNKTIKVPDFKNKTKTDVEKWSKTNKVTVNYNESDSLEVQANSVIDQSVPAEEKISKIDPISVTISKGKGIPVPDFSTLTPETAVNSNGLTVDVKLQYDLTHPYGTLLYQSVASGTKLTEKDDQIVSVIYSIGKPYIKNLEGTSEGELQKLFYDEYQSKGANIRYQVKYVTSSEPEGTVVSTNVSNTYLPLDYIVTVTISQEA